MKSRKSTGSFPSFLIQYKHQNKKEDGLDAVQYNAGICAAAAGTDRPAYKAGLRTDSRDI
jgi:hypothetical protein